MARKENPTLGLVEVMEQLEKDIKSKKNVDLQLFVRACRLGAEFVSSFDGIFDFASVEIKNKVNDQEEAYQKYNTVEVMLNYEITNGLAKENSSHTRFHLRMKRGADLLRVFFMEILAKEGDSLVPPLKKAYNQVFGAYHGESIKMAVNVAMEFMMMDKTDLLKLIDDNDDAARKLMKRYISASASVCEHIEKLYLSTKVGQELLRMI